MLTLWLPALIPSWRFFDRIGPAPSIEYSLAAGDDDWRDVRPRPARVSPVAMVGRLLWNRRWNERLYLISCAERLLDDPTIERVDELCSRVAEIVRAEHGAPGDAAAVSIRIRIVEATRQDGRIVRRVVFVSDARPLAGGSRPAAR